MFREMRRNKQYLPEAEVISILEGGSSGVLALLGEDGWPYAVPLSYAWDGGKLYFHWAKSGQKLDALRREERASFCVVAEDRVVPEKYTTLYRSVIAFGRLRVLEDEEEKLAALERLTVKYAPEEGEASRREEIQRGLPAVCVVEMAVEHVTGKEGKRLAEERARAGGCLHSDSPLC